MVARKRKYILLAAAGLLALLLGGYWLWARGESRINGANFGLVRNGISKAQVEAILGAPTRPYDQQYKAVDAGPGESQPLTVEYSGTWVGPQFHAVVRFDAADVVICREGWYATEPEPLWIRIRRWLHL